MGRRSTLLLALAVTACASRESQVIISREPPPRGCVPRGGVIDLDTSAHNHQARHLLYGGMAEAGRARRANYVYVGSADTETDYVGTVLDWLFEKPRPLSFRESAAGRGRAYWCGTKAERLRQLQSELRNEPDEVSGFVLGSPMADAPGTCRSLGGVWTEGESGPRCDTAPGKFVRLSARDEVVCEIQALDFSDVATEGEWEDVIEAGFERLSDRYGTATEVRRYPIACRSRMRACTLRRQLEQLAVWRWPRGTTVEYAVTTVSGSAATRETYRSSAGP